MSRIQQQFAKRPAFVAYLTAGDGGMARTLEASLALVAGGVDILEIGLPFSDPVADGPTIEQAAERALAQGFTLDQVLQLISDFRQQSSVPIILFSYYTPLFLASKKGFFEKAKNAGVDGCLIVDLPIEEAAEHIQLCNKIGMDPVFLISPSTPAERMKLINQYSRGMLYYACRKGTTGIKDQFPEDFIDKMREIKSHTTLPVAVGFGISNKTMAQKALEYADGFVIGSLFVKAIAEGKSAAQLTELAQSLDPR
jgi:tryptophan synthase alpha chain